MDRDTSLIRLIKRKAFGDSDIINFTDVTTHRLMLLLTIFVGIFMSISFAYYYYKYENIGIGEYIAYLSLSLFFLSSWIMLGRKKEVPIMIPTLLTILPLILLFLRMFYLGGYGFLNGIWILCIPLITLLAGLKFAMIISLGALVVIAAIIFIPGFAPQPIPVNVSVKYFGAYVINCGFAFVYEFSKNKAHYEYVKELKLLGQIDPLTGLLNRRGFLQNAEMLWKQAIREKLPISFLMIDVDHFKEFNDSFGHPKGDICLIQCVSVFKNCVKRPLDLIVRLGGEEFGVLLYNTNLKEAVQLADKIRTNVEKNIIQISENVETNVTVSVGIAATSAKSKNFDEIFVEADAYLYDAKHQGRNQIRYSKERYSTELMDD